MKHLVLFLSVLFCTAVVLGGEQRPFYALCVGTHDAKHRSIEEQNALLKELGYDGTGHLCIDADGWKTLPVCVESAKKLGLKVYFVYVPVNLDNSFQGNLQKISEEIKILKGMSAQLAVNFSGKTADDDKAVRVLEQLAAAAEPLGIKIVLYHHINTYNATVADSLRIAKRFPQKNIGVMFNLCHWGTVDKLENLKTVLEEAKPYLASVTINGMDNPAPNLSKTKRWIMPLDEGTFPQKTLLGILDNIGFTGPVGLQCYGIGGDVHGTLERSIKTFRGVLQQQ